MFYYEKPYVVCAGQTFFEEMLGRFNGIHYYGNQPLTPFSQFAWWMILATSGCVCLLSALVFGMRGFLAAQAALSPLVERMECLNSLSTNFSRLRIQAHFFLQIGFENMSQGTFQSIDVITRGHVAEIMLNRPELHNNITHEMHFEIKNAFLMMRNDSNIRVIIFAAAGKTFSAGGNLDAILADRIDPVQRGKMRAEARPLLMAVADSPVPVITALQGDAIGLGTTLMMGTDAVVAARTARISDPHVVIGLAAGDGGCVTWPLHVGLLRAKRYLLTGDRLTAEDAYAMGMVTDLVDTPADVMPAARALAERIAALPPLAVQATKRALNQVFRNRFEEVFEQGLAYEMDTFISEDLVEAISAFREKRNPTYHGK